MTRATAHPVVRNYVNDLDRALRDLPKARRREIVEEIQEHIEAAVAGSSNEAEIRNVLEQVGDPEVIAEEARDRFGITQNRGGALEGIAIALLLVGGVILPIIGWIVGALLLWMSRTWDLRDKIIGTFVVPGGLALPLYLFLLAPVGTDACTTVTTSEGIEVGSCSTQPLLSGPLGLVLMLVVMLIPVATAYYLGRRAFRR